MLVKNSVKARDIESLGVASKRPRLSKVERKRVKAIRHGRRGRHNIQWGEE